MKPLAQNRKVPDYTGNRSHSNDLAKRLQDYYHTRGHTAVRVWMNN